MSESRYRNSNEFFVRASKTIPTASQTFSKSALNFVRGASPLFLERGKGCRVCDVDGNEFVDFLMGLACVILGYRDEDVDEAVRKQLDRGITLSQATTLELELAEMLTELVPSAEMVRFGKNGSDATGAAVRLARAWTGRDHVVVCGYHGWHDWYIGTTTRHLGVPQSVRELSRTLTFNDSDSLNEVFAELPDQIAAVIMEPATHDEPHPGFLQAVKHACERHGALLVFDEIVTGFRAHLGGAQALYGVEPDLTALGKSMGNGLPISAVVGRTELMTLMDEIFFSGTFGGETLSLAGAIATVKKCRTLDLPARIKSLAQDVREEVGASISRHKLGDTLAIDGTSWQPRWTVISAAHDPSLVTSLLRQELLKEGVLMTAPFNLALAHEEVSPMIWKSFDRALSRLGRLLKKTDPARFLEGQMIQPIFQVRS